MEKKDQSSEDIFAKVAKQKPFSLKEQREMYEQLFDENHFAEALKRPYEEPTGMRKIISDRFIAEGKAAQEIIKILNKKK